jgi:DNA-binding response OmpR family regulator
MARVLIIEDDPKVAAFLELGLRDESFDVTVAHDGADGLERARTEHFDLILLDRMLPRLSGHDLLVELRRSGSQVPVLILSARESADEIRRLLEAGANGYLVKPFRFDDLLERIRALL